MMVATSPGEESTDLLYLDLVAELILYYIYIYIYTHTHTHTYIHIHTHIHTHTHIYLAVTKVNEGKTEGGGGKE